MNHEPTLFPHCRGDCSTSGLARAAFRRITNETFTRLRIPASCNYSPKTGAPYSGLHEQRHLSEQARANSTQTGELFQCSRRGHRTMPRRNLQLQQESARYLFTSRRCSTMVVNPRSPLNLLLVPLVCPGPFFNPVSTGIDSHQRFCYQPLPVESATLHTPPVPE